MSAVAQLPRPARPVPAARPAPLGVLAQVASYFSSTWVLAAAGVVILVVSLVLMAHSAPGQGSAPARAPFHSAQYERAQYERAQHDRAQHERATRPGRPPAGPAPPAPPLDGPLVTIGPR